MGLADSSTSGYDARARVVARGRGREVGTLVLLSRGRGVGCQSREEDYSSDTVIDDDKCRVGVDDDVGGAAQGRGKREEGDGRDLVKKERRLDREYSKLALGLEKKGKQELNII